MTIDESLPHALHKAEHRNVYTNSNVDLTELVRVYVLNMYSNDCFLIFFLKQANTRKLAQLFFLDSCGLLVVYCEEVNQ